MDLLTPSSPGVFQLCLWPLIAPGYLGEGCHASRQPSDASLFATQADTDSTKYTHSKYSTKAKDGKSKKPKAKLNEKVLGETQTQRADCSKTVPKKMFGPPLTPFPGARDGQNLISWRCSLPLPTDPVWWRSMDAISSYRGNRLTHKDHPPIARKQTERTNNSTLHH